MTKVVHKMYTVGDLDSKISYHRKIFWYTIFAMPILA